MENEKIEQIIHHTRVITFSVEAGGMCWSSPVYFVFHAGLFYFLSHPGSRHIAHADNGRVIGASIFHDSDQLDRIFGLQMSGTLTGPVTGSAFAFLVKKYVAKFRFLDTAFGPQVFDNRHFFREQFKSRLYGFLPVQIYFSDNSRTTGKRREIDPEKLTGR